MTEAPHSAVRRTSRCVALLGLLAVSCASPAPVETSSQLFFPLPPDSPRVQYLMSASGSGDVVRERTGLELFTLGDDASPSRRITKPYGIAVWDGAVYVCDTKRPSIAKLDFRNESYAVFGERGAGALRKPINIAIDPLGYKFVSDVFRKQLVVFGPDDVFVKAFDLPEGCHAVDLAIRGDELYVLDNAGCRILVLDRMTGAVRRSMGSEGQEPGQFFKPSSLCLDDAGNIYVSDTLNNRIQKLTPEGEPDWQRGNPGYRLGQFGRPRGIRMASDGVLYIVEGAMQLVQMFDAEGNVLMRFGGPGNIPGAMVLPAAIAIDRSSIPYFKKYVHAEFEVDYLLFVTNQYGPRLINVYAFGGFPEGYRFGEGEIATLAPVEDPAISVGAVNPDAEIPVLPSNHHEGVEVEPQGTEPGEQPQEETEPPEEETEGEHGGEPRRGEAPGAASWDHRSLGDGRYRLEET